MFFVSKAEREAVSGKKKIGLNYDQSFRYVSLFYKDKCIFWQEGLSSGVKFKSVLIMLVFGVFFLFVSRVGSLHSLTN